MALSWVLPDEGSATADQFFSSFSPQTLLWVPALWWYEVANVLAMAERKKRLMLYGGSIAPGRIAQDARDCKG